MRLLNLLRRPSTRPQLRMVYPLRHGPQAGPLPAGYGLRPLAAGDETGWVALLDSVGDLGRWTPQRLAAETRFLADGAQYFATCDDRLVAGAGVYGRSPEAWEIGWIATHPDHRRRGLGGQVTAAAVAAALQLPWRPIVLLTDDHRLPAIRLYLRLGFRPDCWHPSHQSRWRRVGELLGPPLAAPLANL